MSDTLSRVLPKSEVVEPRFPVYVSLATYSLSRQCAGTLWTGCATFSFQTTDLAYFSAGKRPSNMPNSPDQERNKNQKDAGLTVPSQAEADEATIDRDLKDKEQASKKK